MMDKENTFSKQVKSLHQILFALLTLFVIASGGLLYFANNPNLFNSTSKTIVAVRQIEDEDLSKITFYDNDGNEIPKPSDFPTDEQIKTAQAEEQVRMDNIPNVKASAKAKLIAGEKLTEEEANILVGV